MIADIDIWRSASVIIKRYGEDAALEAAKRADEMLEVGGADGCAVWKRIVAAIDNLQRHAPGRDEGIH